MAFFWVTGMLTLSTPKKASAPRPVAAHTSTATTRPAPRSQRTRKPPSDA